MTRRRVGVALALAVVLALVGGDNPSGPAPDLSALDVPPPAGLDLPSARAPEPVLETPAGPAVDVAALRDRVEPLLEDVDLGRHVGFTAYDLTHGRPLWTSGGSDSYIPASTLKLLTATAALEALGGDHVFTTEAVLRRGGRGGVPTVVLVGGGDPLLSSLPPRRAAELEPEPATLDELADQTARVLDERGIARISVGYDVGRYAGPGDNPTWEPDYVPDEVAPISPLWVEEGIDPANPDDSLTDPAGAAATAFALELKARGIAVAGPVTARPGGASRRVLGTVESPPLRDILGYVLDASDNAGAEVLLREVAIATGRPGSFAGGVEAVREVLGALGVPMDGVETYDGSGLSRANRVTLRSVLAVLRIAADERHAELRDVVTRLPVAGFTGTLAFRFVQPEADAGLGWVRAKTGTLSHVHGLAGTAMTRDGVTLAFVALVDRVPLPDTLDARATLDSIAAALAGCGCARPPS